MKDIYRMFKIMSDLCINTPKEKEKKKDRIYDMIEKKKSTKDISRMCKIIKDSCINIHCIH